jgi:Lysozyme like domain/Putative peptidoglycan binding domain
MATMLEMAREVIRYDFYDPPTLVAVGWAESRGQTNAVGVVRALRPDGTPLPWHGSRDRGVYQINSYFHPTVSDACAFNLACATKETHRISSAGRNMQPWNTFRVGAHVPFMAEASKAYFLAVKERQAAALPRRPDWWNQWIDRAGLPTLRLLDGPRWEIAYAQEVLRVCAKQHVQTTGMFDTPTCAAVKSAQRFFGQKADGIIGLRMWGLLHYLAKTKTRP